MANDSGPGNSAWPLLKFFFAVDFGGDINGILFQEVSGLDLESQVIEYRDGNSPVFSPVKMPGIAIGGNVTLKHGIFLQDSGFFDWFNEIKMNTIKRRTVVIKLSDESGSVTMQWTLKNAWPIKVIGGDLKSGANEIAVESIELVHEGLEIIN